MLVKQKTGEIETFTVMMVIMMMIPMKMMMMLNVETCEKVPHVNFSISCREGEEEQDNHKQGDFTPISGEFRFQKLVRSHNCHQVDRDSISIVIHLMLDVLDVVEGFEPRRVDKQRA